MTFPLAPASFVEVLRARAADQPDATALVFLDADGGQRPVSRGELDRGARGVAAALRAGGTQPGDRALLLYPPGLDYVLGFLGCLYGGVVAVPVVAPRDARGLERVLAIAADADVAITLTDQASQSGLREHLGGARQLRLLPTDGLAAGGLAAEGLDTDGLDTDGLDTGLCADTDGAVLGLDSLAFLQYTSGSTAAPKGVMVSQGNLVSNSQTIAAVLGVDEQTRGVSWLPPYHDMGLIGGILQPLYSGFACLLMAPATFLYRPARWLQAISQFRATSSAAPDFAYAECVRRVSDDELRNLDLSCWQHALVGAEPVRAQTLAAFADRFAAAGFRREAFLPCYGLAEATLFVTGARTSPEPAQRLLDRGELSSGVAAAPAADADAAVDGSADSAADSAAGRAADGSADGSADSSADSVRLVSCGRPAGPDRVAVVDPHTGGECSDGTVGEVWVSGPSVAGGYWAKAELTHQAFGARLAGDGHWLRTGDLGFLDAGELYVTGRTKDLIVVRGANHYPQDIEQTAERASTALWPGRGAAFSLDDGASELVVLVLEARTTAEPAAVVEAVLAAVATTHGLTLHEVVLVRRGGVPRTSSGKVQRGQCRARYLAGTLPVLARADEGASTGRPPGSAESVDTGQGPTAAGARGGQAALTAIVAAALDRDPAVIDPDRPLVVQGLDSLRAARLRSVLAGQFGVDLELADLLGGMTVTELASAAAAGQSPRIAPVPPLPDGARTPASLGQQRLWLLDALGAGPAYHVTAVLWLSADPDLAAVRQALRLLVERHEALRTGVLLAEDGQLDQVVCDQVEVPVPQGRAADRASCLDAVRRWAAEPFRLAEPPLLRAALHQAGDSWALALCAHHLVVDGESFDVVLREFGLAYTAIRQGRTPTPEPLPTRYRDFAAWQRASSSDPWLEQGLRFWRGALAGASAPELTRASTGASGPATTFDGDTVPVELPASLVAALRGLAQAQGATLFMVLAAGLATVLGRWSGRTDVLLGTASAGRPHPGLDGLVGLFINTLPLRVDLAGDPTFPELVGRARDFCLKAYPHRDVPFERIVHEVQPGSDGAGPRPLVRHLLLLQPAPPSVDLAGHPAVSTVLPARGAKFDLELELAPDRDGGLTGWLSYATELFHRADADRLVADLRRLLDTAATDPAQRLSELTRLGQAEHALVVEQFSGVRCPPVTEPVVPLWFESQVDATPAEVAVVDPSGEEVSYAELDVLANRLAHHLRGLGVGVEDRVAVCLHRGVRLSTALLAVLKAGAAYLPLDPSYPVDRLDYLIRDAAPSVVLTTSDLSGVLGAPPATVVLLDRDELTAPADRPRCPSRPDGAAYVLYTSGSTGQPKGTVNTHGGLVNLLRWAQQWHPLGPGDRALQKTPIGFDVSVWELLLPLVVGATLVYARPDGHREPVYLHQVLDEQRISVCHFVPSMLRAFLEVPSSDHPGLRAVFCSGEELPAPLAGQFLDRFPTVELHNVYGPAEAAIEVTAYQVPAGPTPRRVPLGRPMPGAELYVLDERHRPRPLGVAGELFIGGVQVARGYHGRPALTAQRFLPHPFRAGERLYATGDQARWLPDGTLEYLGRIDHQVKIRGHRTEPAEIEAALLGHPDVTTAVVLARPDRHGELFLAAYLLGERRTEPAQLREFLTQRLPAYLVPTAFSWLDSLPLLPNGKIDRATLAARPVELAATEEYAAPRTPVERALAEIWAEVLGVDRVGRNDGFFELGGHSLLAVRILGRVRMEFGIGLEVGDLLRTTQPTVTRLAELVERRHLEQTPADELQELLGVLDGLSDEEVRQRLAEHHP